MGIKIYSNSGKISYGIKHYIIDTLSEMNNLYDDCGVGSTIFITENSKKYILNTKKEWVEILNNNSENNNEEFFIIEAPLDSNMILGTINRTNAELEEAFAAKKNIIILTTTTYSWTTNQMTYQIPLTTRTMDGVFEFANIINVFGQEKFIRVYTVGYDQDTSNLPRTVYENYDGTYQFFFDVTMQNNIITTATPQPGSGVTKSAIEEALSKSPNVWAILSETRDNRRVVVGKLLFTDAGGGNPVAAGVLYDLTSAAFNAYSLTIDSLNDVTIISTSVT